MYSFHAVVHRHRVKGKNSQVTMESTVNRSSIWNFLPINRLCEREAINPKCTWLEYFNLM